MTAVANSCADCGTALGDVRREQGGDYLCRHCYERRQPKLPAVPAANPPVMKLYAAASSWMPVDLAPILSGEHEPERPEMLRRTDGIGLLYRGRLHAVFAEPEAGKGWLALTAAKELLEAGGSVTYIDYEDMAVNLVARLRDLGVPDDAILARFRYLRPDEPVTDGDLSSLAADLVVIDGVTEALAVEGLNLADNQDIATFYARFPRPFATAGAAVLLIDHVVKDKEARGRYAIGGQHKLAAVDVAYRLDVIRPFARGKEGLVKVTVTKDRPGFVRQHSLDSERVGLFRGRSTEEGRMVTVLEPAEAASDPSRPTFLMERISRELEERPGVNKGGIRKIKGNSDYLDIALDLLIREGFVEARQERNSIRHYSLKPYREPTS